MQYQTFPDVKGGSRSLEKLAALRLPDCQGKRFLDVGCNEGFFCGYALFNGASQVVGIDRSADVIARAQQRFPEAEFRQQSWATLPEGPFDVITLLSALHYAEDQESLIHRLMEQLADDGLLVLEISLAQETGDQWVKVQRSIDERYFPTRQKLGKVLESYAWKIIGHSVRQAGDPLLRYVVHVRKMKPYVYLLMGRPGSGKSTISRRLFKQAKVPVVTGDRLYLQLSQGKYQVSQALRQCVQKSFSTTNIDKVTQRLCEQGLMAEVVALWVSLGGERDFAVDSFVPEAFQSEVRDAFLSQGYFPVDMQWTQGVDPKASFNAQVNAKAYERYLGEQVGKLRGTRIEVTSMVAPSLKKLLRWHLDAPVPGEWLGESASVKVSGWLVGFDAFEGPLSLYADDGKHFQQFTLKRKRQDVLKAVFGDLEQVPNFWQQYPCGFVFTLTNEQICEGVEMGVMREGERFPLARLNVTSHDDQPRGKLGQRLIRSLRSLG